MSDAKPVPVQIPAGGEKISMSNGILSVPDHPIIPYIEGDGTGRDIWRASVRVFDAAVQNAYQGARQIRWMEVFAGEKANKAYNTWLPDETVKACRDYLISIKGPLTTPVGGGIRSLNVALRQLLIFTCACGRCDGSRECPRRSRRRRRSTWSSSAKTPKIFTRGSNSKKAPPSARNFSNCSSRAFRSSTPRSV